MWKFTTIQHAPRRAMGLNPLEYCVFDFIYRSQTYPGSSTPGWCATSYGDIAKSLDVSKSTVHSAIERAVKWKLAEVDETDPSKKRMLRTWYDVAYLEQLPKDLKLVNYRQRSKNERKKSVRKTNGSVRKTNGSVRKTNEIVRKTNVYNKGNEGLNKGNDCAPSGGAEETPGKQQEGSRSGEEGNGRPEKINWIKEMATLFDTYHKEYFKTVQADDYVPYVWKVAGGRDFRHLKNIMATIRIGIAKKRGISSTEVTKEEIVEGFEMFLRKFLINGSDWKLRNYFSPAMIDSKFNEILNEINTHGNQAKKTGRTGTNRTSQGVGEIDREFGY